MLSCLGALVILLGRVVFALLEPTCGPEGHRVCYEDCPMSGGAVGLHDICDFGITTAGYVLLCLGQLRDPQYWLQVPRALQREEEVEDIAAHKSEAGSAEQVVMPEQVGRT